MAIDPSILLRGVSQPVEIENPLNAFARVLQVKGLQGQQRVQDMQIQQAERDLAENNAFKSLLQNQGFDFTTPQGQAELLRAAPNKGAAFIKQQQELEKSRVDTRKVQAEIFGKIANEEERLARSVLANPTPENAMRAVQQFGQIAEQFGVPFDAQAEMSALQAMTDPNQIRQWAAGKSLEAKELLGQIQSLDLGGVQRTQRVNPVTGEIEVLGENRKTMAPGEAARLSQDESQFRRSQAQQYELATRPQFNAEAGGFVVPPNQQAPQGSVIPVQGVVPASARKEIMEINQQRATIQGALDAVKATPEAFSIRRGLVGNLPLGETIAGINETPAQTQARAYVFNNVSAVINQRAGAAQSAQELQRLRGFLPADTDPPQLVESKLQGFLQYLDDREKGTLNKSNAQRDKPAVGPKQVTSEADYNKLKAGEQYLDPNGNLRTKR